MTHPATVASSPIWTMLVPLLGCGCAAAPCAPVSPPPTTTSVTQALQAVVREPADLAASRARLEDAKEHGEPEQLVSVVEATIAWVAARREKTERLVDETHDLERRLEATERALLDIQQRFDETSTLAELLADERLRLTKRIQELEAEATTRAKELHELQGELEALKKIDMDRNP